MWLTSWRAFTRAAAMLGAPHTSRLPPPLWDCRLAAPLGTPDRYVGIRTRTIETTLNHVLGFMTFLRSSVLFNDITVARERRDKKVRPACRFRGTSFDVRVEPGPRPRPPGSPAPNPNQKET